MSLLLPLLTPSPPVLAHMFATHITLKQTECSRAVLVLMRLLRQRDNTSHDVQLECQLLSALGEEVKAALDDACSSSSGCGGLPLHHLGHMVGSCLNAASAASLIGVKALTASVAPWMERLDYLAAVYVLASSSSAFPLHHSLTVLSVIEQPRLVRSHVASLLPHARDPSIGVSVFPHEWHSLINYLCASCLECSEDKRILADVQELLATAHICPPFAAHFRSAILRFQVFSKCARSDYCRSAVHSFFLPPPAVILAGAAIDRVCAAIDAGHSSCHWMILWRTMYPEESTEAPSTRLASELTAAMLCAAAAGPGHTSGRRLDLSKFFKEHSVLRSLFAVMT